MRLSRSWALLLGLPLLVAASNTLVACGDDEADGGSDAGTGGSSAADAGTGGAATEDVAPPPLDCPDVDASADECRTCLGTYCCDDFTACVANSTCNADFNRHRECIASDTVDPSSCFMALSMSEAGAASQGVALCIIQHCRDCGAPGLL